MKVKIYLTIFFPNYNFTDDDNDREMILLMLIRIGMIIILIMTMIIVVNFPWLGGSSLGFRVAGSPDGTVGYN